MAVEFLRYIPHLSKKKAKGIVYPISQQVSGLTGLKQKVPKPEDMCFQTSINVSSPWLHALALYTIPPADISLAMVGVFHPIPPIPGPIWLKQSWQKSELVRSALTFINFPRP
jgi:hypothetical protein